MEVRLELEESHVLQLVQVLYKANNSQFTLVYIDTMIFSDLKLVVKLHENNMGWYLSVLALSKRILGGCIYVCLSWEENYQWWSQMSLEITSPVKHLGKIYKERQSTLPEQLLKVASSLPDRNHGNPLLEQRLLSIRVLGLILQLVYQFIYPS